MYEDNRKHLSLAYGHPMYGNVACLNGWAHVKTTSNERAVTCSECLEAIKNGYHLKRGKPAWKLEFGNKRD
jgi:hypothetical protein